MSGKHWKAILAAVLAFVLLFSVLYLALEADHDCCHGEDCAICAQIHACVQLLRQLTLTLALALPVLSHAGTFAVLHRGFARACRQTNLITLKVKLSD